MRIFLLGSLFVLSVGSSFARFDESSSLGYPALELGSGMLSGAQLPGSDLVQNNIKPDSGKPDEEVSSEFRKEVARADAMGDIKNPLGTVEFVQETASPLPGDLSNETTDLFSAPPEDNTRALVEAMSTMEVVGP